MTSAVPASAPRSALGRAYLDHLRGRPAADPAGLPAAAALNGAYSNHVLPGPLFLSAAERREVMRDVYQLYDLLRSVPERIFGGDLAAFARAVGMTGPQVDVVTRSATAGPLLPLGRADLYHDGDRFALLELNVSSALGGLYTGDINRALLSRAALRDFAERHNLHYRDTVACLVETILAECGPTLPGGRPPTIAVVDTAENFRLAGDRLRLVATKLRDHGVDSVACELEQLSYPRGRPAYDGRTIDVVLRYFLIEDLADPATAALLEPLLTAVERGTVAMVSRIDAELYGNKGTLALLSDDRHRSAFTAGERGCADRLLPWTRQFRSRVTDPAGTQVDALAYAEAHRRELVLKPALLHGGAGVVAGWRTAAEQWRAELKNAVDGPFVLQRRVRPAAETIAGGSGTQVIHPNWGIYFAGVHAAPEDGYAGCMVRASTDPDVGVVSLADGALLGCAFHAE